MWLLLLLGMFVASILAPVAAGQKPVSAATADVVVLVDTSTSMSQRDMDPQRSSLLVTKLLVDIVPGDLAAVRLLDLAQDKQWLPSRNTGRMMPCSEDPSKQCNQVEPLGDWYRDTREKRYGVLVRPVRGDNGFKQRLDSHLSQVINNTMFGLAFRAGQGVFDSHGTSNTLRIVIWLSDGNTDDPNELAKVVRELTDAGVIIEPVVFGHGNVRLANSLGLSPKQARNPAELIKAFADAFRRIVQAPYEVDNLVAAQPSFEMKPSVDEAWIVVYGDDSLGEVMIDSPGGPRRADSAEGRREGAGAYRVLYVQQPTPGTWAVRATGGGPVAYAVVQRSALTPMLLEPQTALAGVPVALIAGIGSEPGGSALSANDLPEGVSLEAEINGRTIRLVDDGTNGDATAHDGHFSSMITFEELGEVPVIVRARSTLLDRLVRGKVTVTGMFRARGGPVDVDLGNFTAPGEACRDFRADAEQAGVLPFELDAARSLPSGHKFEIRGTRGVLRTGGGAVPHGPSEELKLCLVASTQAPSSAGFGEHWLDLRLAGSNAIDSRVSLNVRWNLRGLTWWERWRSLIITILIILLLLFCIYGYVEPKRFPRALAVTFVPEREEVDEQTPQPVVQWPGVGIGWYRDARACLHPNFRLTGKLHGAMAVLSAISDGTEVRPGGGYVLYRETIDSEWEPVASAGRRIVSGEVYRVAENGPYFRVSMRKL